MRRLASPNQPALLHKLGGAEFGERVATKFENSFVGWVSPRIQGFNAD